MDEQNVESRAVEYYSAWKREGILTVLLMQIILYASLESLPNYFLIACPISGILSPYSSLVTVTYFSYHVPFIMATDLQVRGSDQGPASRATSRMPGRSQAAHCRSCPQGVTTGPWEEAPWSAPQTSVSKPRTFRHSRGT